MARMVTLVQQSLQQKQDLDFISLSVVKIGVSVADD